MRPVVWSRDALDDLKNIVAYIARERGLEAYSVLERIEEAGKSLQTFATGRRGRVTGTYEKPVSALPYILAYAIDQRRADAEVIVILRVIHGQRHWPEDAWPQ